MSTSGGGLVSTCVIVAASTGGGMLLSLLQALDAATRSITGPQATLIIGATGLALQYGPRAVKWVAKRAADRVATTYECASCAYMCASCHKNPTPNPTDICEKCVRRAHQ